MNSKEPKRTLRNPMKPIGTLKMSGHSGMSEGEKSHLEMPLAPPGI